MAEENEPNDQNANSIQLGEKITGVLSSNTDRDGYSFSVNGPSTISVDFDVPTNSSYNDYFNIYIQDGAGNIIASTNTGQALQ